tara:strand:+ start:8947 stop:9453 length:507 start_codon:yes stop_codon:yes gene_type:complete
MWNPLTASQTNTPGSNPESHSDPNSTQGSKGSLPRQNGFWNIKKDFADLAVIQQLKGMQTELNNERRAVSMGDRQLREHYPDSWEKPEYDSDMQYHSPTTTNYYQPPPEKKTNLWPWLALMGLGAMGSSAYWDANRDKDHHIKPQPQGNTTTNTTEVWRLEAGEGPNE